MGLSTRGRGRGLVPGSCVVHKSANGFLGYCKHIFFDRSIRSPRLRARVCVRVCVCVCVCAFVLRMFVFFLRKRMIVITRKTTAFDKEYDVR